MTFKEIWSHWRTGIKSSIQGSIVGIVPGLSYILSSTVCYNSSLRKRPGDSLSAVIASETGSTTGLFTSLIPLFLFGIPITVSEGLIYSSMVEKGAMFAQGLFLLTNLEILIATFIIVNIVAVILSWPLAPRLMQIFTRIDVTYLRWFILTVAVATVIIIGIMEHRLMFYLLCYLSMVVVGFFLKNKEVLPLIFVFVLQENIDYSMFTLWQIIN
jgi:putative tricarboxylic transport membrane protein